MKEQLGVGEPIKTGEIKSAALTVERWVNEEANIEHVLLIVRTDQPGEYETPLGPVTIVGVQAVKNPISRSKLRLDLEANGWLKKGRRTRYGSYRPRKIHLTEGKGKQQLRPAYSGTSIERNRWLLVDYQVEKPDSPEWIDN
jgi:hypothetical protein